MGPRRQVTAPVSDPGEQAAQRPQREQATRPGPVVPCSLANATVVTSAAPKRVPSAAETTASGADGGPRHPRSPAGGAVVRVRRGLGGALGAQGQRPADAGDDRDRDPGHRVPGRGQHRHHDRAEHEDRLVDDGLDRERRLEHVAVCASSTCDQRARTAEPIWGRAPPASAAQAYDARPSQPASTDATSSTIATREAAARHRQHPTLPERCRAAGPGGSPGRRWRPCTPPRPRRPRRTSRWPPRRAARCPGRPWRSAAAPPGRWR